MAYSAQPRVNLKGVMATGLCPRCKKYRLTKNHDGDMECLCGFIIYDNGLTSMLTRPSAETIDEAEETPSPSGPALPIDTTKLERGTQLHGPQLVVCNGCGTEFKKAGATITAGRRSFHSWACMMDADGKKHTIEKPNHKPPHEKDASPSRMHQKEAR